MQPFKSLLFRKWDSKMNEQFGLFLIIYVPRVYLLTSRANSIFLKKQMNALFKCSVLFGTTARGSSLRYTHCPSDTLVTCDHTFQPIKTILVSLVSPQILVSGK